MKFLLWFIIAVLVVRMLRKNIFISVQRSFNEQMKNQMNHQNQKETKPEGTITIENKKPHNLKKNNTDDNDFVDYEEVK